MKTVRRLARRPWRLAWLIGIYLWDLMAASAIVAWEVVTPLHGVRPGIVRVPLKARTDFEIALLSNMISFTPGTLTLGIESDHSAIYVHALHMHSPERVREDVGRLERRVLRVLR
jgi:multicomponent Na+:H+ antiporter subunit E